MNKERDYVIITVKMVIARKKMEESQEESVWREKWKTIETWLTLRGKTRKNKVYEGNRERRGRTYSRRRHYVTEIQNTDV